MKNVLSNGNAVGYIRVSTAGQVEDGAGLEIQRSRILEYCKQNGLTLNRIYEDKAMSGAMRDRPALLDLLKDCEEGHIKRIVVLRQDRLSREMGLTIFIDNTLNKYGVQLTSILEPILDLNGDGLAKVIRRMLALFSEYEKDLIASRLVEGRRNNAKNGERGSGPIPFGYTKVGDKLVIKQDEAQWVVKIFRWVAKGYSYTKIIDILSKRGVTTRRGNKFSISSLRYILSSEIYFGAINFDGVRSKGVHQAITSKRLFLRANRLAEK